MKTIEIEDGVYEALLGQVQSFGETANDVVSRLLNPMKELNVVRPEAENVDQELLTLCVTVEQTCRSGIGRYLAVLRFMYNNAPEKFECIAQSTRGSRRLYISKSELEIQRTGSSTKPKSVVGTPYYAATNLSKRLMQRILNRLMRAYGDGQPDLDRVRSLIATT
jgi:negative modulator of initiation of replication